MPEVRSPGYFWSQAELDAVLKQMANWQERAYADPSQYGDAHAFAASQLGAMIQLRGALRIGELTALQDRDLKIYRDGVGCEIRQRPSHSLKSPASVRHSCIEMTRQETQCLFDLVSKLHNRRTDRGNELLAWEYRMHRTSISAQCNKIVGHAMRHVLPREHARTHAGRHNHASRAGYMIQPQRFSPFELHIAGSHQQALTALDRLPRRLAYRYFSRQMGHAGSDTTLIWYDHTSALMTDCDRFWEGPSRCIEWRLAITQSPTSMTLEAWSRATQRFQSREHNGRRCRPPWTKLINHAARTKPSDPPPVSVDIPEKLIPSHAGLLLSFAHVALRGRNSEAALDISNINAIQELANEVGVSRDAAASMLSELKHYDAHLGTQYLVTDRKRPSLLPRIARAHIFIPVLRRLQEQLENGSVKASDLSDWVRRNRATPHPNRLAFEQFDAYSLEAFKTEFPNGRFKTADDVTLMHVERHERQFICLVWYTYAQFTVEDKTHPPARRRIELTTDIATGAPS